jgi:hypothetical protein
MRSQRGRDGRVTISFRFERGAQGCETEALRPNENTIVIASVSEAIQGQRAPRWGLSICFAHARNDGS